MIGEVLEMLIRDCISRRLSEHTVDYYRRQILIFQGYCESQGVFEIEQITADVLRRYLIHIQELGKKPGPKYRAVKVLLMWYEREMEPEGWRNPIHKVRHPRESDEPIEGVSIEQVRSLLSTCDSDRFTDVRDRAYIMFLLDTGCRVQESLDLNMDEIYHDGTVNIRNGKGGKPRITYVGLKTRKAMRKYFRRREDRDPAVWVNQEGSRLQVSTVQGMLERRCDEAGIPKQSPHDFRRAFVLNMLRSRKVDVYDLKMMTGHTTLEVLERYARKVREDAQLAHAEGSPVDHLL